MTFALQQAISFTWKRSMGEERLIALGQAHVDSLFQQSPAFGMRTPMSMPIAVIQGLP
jgi:hypothetical protein